MNVSLALLAVVASVMVGRVALRVLGPIPPSDISAIRAHLAVNAQELERLEPLVFGGPWRTTFNGGRRQGGRPYRVTAREADGSRWVHVLAIDGVDQGGAPRVRERVNGAWRPD
jgi:hypothetical protein